VFRQQHGVRGRRDLEREGTPDVSASSRTVCVPGTVDWLSSASSPSTVGDRYQPFAVVEPRAAVGRRRRGRQCAGRRCSGSARSNGCGRYNGVPPRRRAGTEPDQPLELAVAHRVHPCRRPCRPVAFPPRRVVVVAADGRPCPGPNAMLTT